jgi:hypothetical protein
MPAFHEPGHAVPYAGQDVADGGLHRRGLAGRQIGEPGDMP